MESFVQPVYYGKPAGAFPLVQSEELNEVHEQIPDIAAWETEDD